jgi:hypothetical protein
MGIKIGFLCRFQKGELTLVTKCTFKKLFLKTGFGPEKFSAFLK